MKTLTYKVEVSIPDTVKLSPAEITTLIENCLMRNRIRNCVYVQRITEKVPRFAPLQIDTRLPEPLKNVYYCRTTWENHLKIYEQYDGFQTPEQIAQRGGFGIREAHDYYGWNNPLVMVSEDGKTWMTYRLEFTECFIRWIKEETKNETF